MDENNFWLARRLRREQFKYRMDFLRCLSQGGSYDIDWDTVNEKSFGKKAAARMKEQVGAWTLPQRAKETDGNS